MMAKILHLTVDYPSVNKPVNTLAVKNLIGSLKDQEHLVFALTRTANPFKVNAVYVGNVVSIRYWGLPYGIGLFLSMFVLSLRILLHVKKLNFTPTLVHGHKFAFEGIASWLLARYLKIPFFVSVRGEADVKILRYKPHYKFFFQKLLNDCAHVFYVSAWFRPILNDYFILPEDKQSLLPNFVSERNIVSSEVFVENSFITVLDLNVYEKKGLDRLLKAMSRLVKSSCNIRLDVVGRGTSEVIHEVQTMIERLDLTRNVKLLGPLGNDELLARLPGYAALLLPSRNETFGMVYVEALLSCVPVLCSKNTGVDGFIDWVSAHVAVDPYSVASIEEGIRTIIVNQFEYRAWLLKNSGCVQDYFYKQRYVTFYQEKINVN